VLQVAPGFKDHDDAMDPRSCADLAMKYHLRQLSP
jgi:hypothetical protein